MGKTSSDSFQPEDETKGQYKKFLLLYLPDSGF